MARCRRKQTVKVTKAAGDKPPPYNDKSNAKALLTLAFQKFFAYLPGEKAFSYGRRGTAIVVDEELLGLYDTSSVSLRLPPSPAGEGLVGTSPFAYK